MNVSFSKLRKRAASLLGKNGEPIECDSSSSSKGSEGSECNTKTAADGLPDFDSVTWQQIAAEKPLSPPPERASVDKHCAFNICTKKKKKKKCEAELDPITKYRVISRQDFEAIRLSSGPDLASTIAQLRESSSAKEVAGSLSFGDVMLHDEKTLSPRLSRRISAPAQDIQEGDEQYFTPSKGRSPSGAMTPEPSSSSSNNSSSFLSSNLHSSSSTHSLSSLSSSSSSSSSSFPILPTLPIGTTCPSSADQPAAALLPSDAQVFAELSPEEKLLHYENHLLECQQRTTDADLELSRLRMQNQLLKLQLEYREQQIKRLNPKTQLVTGYRSLFDEHSPPADFVGNSSHNRRGLFLPSISWLSFLAVLAYSPPLEVHEVVGSLWPGKGLPSPTALTFFSDPATDTWAFGYYYPATNEAVLSFRGTISDENWKTNFNVKLTALEEEQGAWRYPDYALRDLCVHSGFNRAFLSIWPQLKEFILQFPPSATLSITGHSLGGALANLCYLYLTAFYPSIGVEQVVTFGQPRCGTSTVGRFLQTHGRCSIIRIRNESDAVPLIPPKRPLGFAHLIHCQYLLGDGSLVQNRPRKTGTTTRGIFAANAISDHSMELYCRRLNRGIERLIRLRVSGHTLPVTRSMRIVIRVIDRFKRLPTTGSYSVSVESSNSNWIKATTIPIVASSGSDEIAIFSELVLYPVWQGDIFFVRFFKLSTAGKRVLGFATFAVHEFRSVPELTLLLSRDKTNKSVGSLQMSYSFSDPPGYLATSSSPISSLSASTPLLTASSRSLLTASSVLIGTNDSSTPSSASSATSQSTASLPSSAPSFFGRPFSEIADIRLPHNPAVRVIEFPAPDIIKLLAFSLIRRVNAIPHAFFAHICDFALDKLKSDIDHLNLCYFLMEDPPLPGLVMRILYEWVRLLPSSPTGPAFYDRWLALGSLEEDPRPYITQLIADVGRHEHPDLPVLLMILSRISTMAHANKLFTEVDHEDVAAQLRPILFYVQHPVTGEKLHIVEDIPQLERALVRLFEFFRDSAGLVPAPWPISFPAWLGTAPPEYACAIVRDVAYMAPSVRFPEGVVVSLNDDSVLTFFDPSKDSPSFYWTLLDPGFRSVFGDPTSGRLFISGPNATVVVTEETMRTFSFRLPRSLPTEPFAPVNLPSAICRWAAIGREVWLGTCEGKVFRMAEPLERKKQEEHHGEAKKHRSKHKQKNANRGKSDKEPKETGVVLADSGPQQQDDDSVSEVGQTGLPIKITAIVRSGDNVLIGDAGGHIFKTSIHNKAAQPLEMIHSLAGHFPNSSPDEEEREFSSAEFDGFFSPYVEMIHAGPTLDPFPVTCIKLYASKIWVCAGGAIFVFDDQCQSLLASLCLPNESMAFGIIPMTEDYMMITGCSRLYRIHVDTLKVDASHNNPSLHASTRAFSVIKPFQYDQNQAIWVQIGTHLVVVNVNSK